MNWSKNRFSNVRIARVNDWGAGVDNLDYSDFAAEIAENVLMP